MRHKEIIPLLNQSLVSNHDESGTFLDAGDSTGTRTDETSALESFHFRAETRGKKSNKSHGDLSP